jgi:peptide/nickel transport system permease protein
MSTHKRANFKRRCGFLLIISIAMAALLAPLIIPVDSNLSPFCVHLASINTAIGTNGHFLGTDALGRDVLGLLLWGARTSLLVGLCSAAAAVSIGSLWGAFSALAGGIVEAIMMRLIDVLLAVPSIILLLLAAALVNDFPYQKFLPSYLLNLLGITSYSNGLMPLLTVIVIISATTWLEVARLTSARIKSVLSEEYVKAAVVAGLSFWQLTIKHLLPNAGNIIAVEASLLVADAILSEAGLSFLGLGIGPSTPSWGSMLNSAQQSLLVGNWWSVVAPGMIITITVLAIQLISQKNDRGNRLP